MRLLVVVFMECVSYGTVPDRATPSAKVLESTHLTAIAVGDTNRGRMNQSIHNATTSTRRQGGLRPDACAQIRLITVALVAPSFDVVVDPGGMR